MSERASGGLYVYIFTNRKHIYRAERTSLPTGATARTTESQREVKERLQKTQRRRAELMNERRKVRNWNVKEGEDH